VRPGWQPRGRQEACSDRKPTLWNSRQICCLRRPHKCQKRPTTGAKETYYMLTFEGKSAAYNCPLLGVEVFPVKCQKWPSIEIKRDLQLPTARRRGLSHVAVRGIHAAPGGADIFFFISFFIPGAVWKKKHRRCYSVQNKHKNVSFVLRNLQHEIPRKRDLQCT